MLEAQMRDDLLRGFNDVRRGGEDSAADLERFIGSIR
jgi:hypothetical protein